MARRSYGTGSIVERSGSYYGQWRVTGRLVKRKLGPIRRPGTRDGLTRAQAEARVRKLIEETGAAPPAIERMTVDHAGGRLIAHLTTLGRKRSTVQGYESFLRVHLVPHFGDQPLTAIDRHNVETFMAACRDHGQSVKSTLNYLGLLHGIFEYAITEGWAATNPCKRVAKPRASEADPDIPLPRPGRARRAHRRRARRRARPGRAGAVPRRRYDRCRQGELLALRWQDVDWPARRIRIRRNLVRGEFGTPKSKRSSRSVPLADLLGGQLDKLHQATVYGADRDLVFAHPHTGRPLDRSKLLKRFKAALSIAGVREVRFHDLRHTFGTRMAAAGVPMRTLQEWMGHRDFKTTLIYADYMPGEREADLVDAAFAPRGINLGINSSETQAY